MKKVIYVKFEVAAESYEEGEKKVSKALADPNNEANKEVLKTHKIVNKVHM